MERVMQNMRFGVLHKTENLLSSLGREQKTTTKYRMAVRIKRQ